MSSAQDKINAVKLITLALEVVESNGGLPVPDDEELGIVITSFRQLVLQYAKNTNVASSVIDEMMDIPLGVLAASICESD